MNTVFTTEEVIAVFRRMADTVAENEQYLNELDSTIGDAEHGLNLKRGFGAVLAKLDSLKDMDPAAAIKRVGTTLAGSGCGSGPTFFGLAIRAAGDSLQKTGMNTPADLAQAFEAAVSTIKEKGGAEVGHKTMVDALEPAVLAFRASVCRGESLESAMKASVSAAEAGMRSTTDMIGVKGRGFHAGERGIGHQDPGATSAYLLLKSIMDTVTNR
ncbi:MAG: dihydroxyacetone kinase subunit DhaL [Firmicutes bacterium]|jgi:dihydroxyacetone kinase-like protein|nr:dihydroxyacetone kinase subunit DhaL [Bacillota bacterium]